MIFQCLTCERIELSSFSIPFNLTIPGIRLKLKKPVSELR